MWGKTWTVFAFYCTLVAESQVRVRNESGYAVVSIDKTPGAKPPFTLSAFVSSEENNVEAKIYMSDQIQSSDDLKNYVNLNNMPYYSSAIYEIWIGDGEFVGYGYIPPKRPILVEPIGGECASDTCKFYFQNIDNKLKNRTDLYIVGTKESVQGFNITEYIKNNVSRPDSFKYRANITNEQNNVTIENLPNYCNHNLWLVPVNTFEIPNKVKFQMFGNSTLVNVTRDCSRNSEGEVSSAMTTVIVILVVLVLIFGTVAASYYLIKVRRSRVPRRNNTQTGTEKFGFVAPPPEADCTSGLANWYEYWNKRNLADTVLTQISDIQFVFHQKSANNEEEDKALEEDEPDYDCDS